MSDDELKNRTPHTGGAEDSGADATSRNAEITQPDDDREPRYDVAGAALGALGRAEETDLYAAAAVDPSVSADLAAMEAVAAELARLSPVQPMNRGRSAGIRSRLVARAAGTHVGRPVTRAAIPAGDTERQQARPPAGTSARPTGARSAPRPPVSSPPRHTGSVPVAGSPAPKRQPRPGHTIPFEQPSGFGMRHLIGAVAIAAVVVIAAFGLYNWRAGTLRGNSEAAMATRDSNLEAEVASLRTSVAQKDSLIAALTGTHTRVIDLIGYNSVDPMARMFWDQKTQMFIMYASNVKPPPSGKTYQVWLIARGVASPVSVGTFMPDSAGSAVLATKHPMEPGTLRRIAVTEEPMGGMSTPTGKIMFTGVGK